MSSQYFWHEKVSLTDGDDSAAVKGAQMQEKSSHVKRFSAGLGSRLNGMSKR